MTTEQKEGSRLKGVVYKIENLVNGFIYIGSSCRYEKRAKRHFEDLKYNKHHCIYLQRAYNKYGVDSFKITVIESIEADSKEDVLAREQFYIDTLNPQYNICVIAGSQLGLKRDDVFRKNVSERMKGKLPWNFGLKLPCHSEETRLKRSASLMGRTVSDNNKQAIRERTSKAVIQKEINGDIVKEYSSLKEASRVFGCSHGRLCEFIKGKSNIKTFKGFLWELKITA
jgi:group I intron endonuclease